jgi:hypothetical protein
MVTVCIPITQTIVASHILLLEEQKRISCKIITTILTEDMAFLHSRLVAAIRQTCNMQGPCSCTSATDKSEGNLSCIIARAES